MSLKVSVYAASIELSEIEINIRYGMYWRRASFP